MTDTSQPPADKRPAAIEPVVAGALAYLTDKPDATMAVLAERVAIQPEPVDTEVAQPFPDLPAHVELTEEARDAMKRLADVFNSVELGGKRRSLEQGEIARLTAELGVIASITSVLGPRVDAIKETIRVHMDVDAEESGIAVPKDVRDTDSGLVITPATPRDQNGHYLLAGPKQPHNIPCGPVFWSQQFSAGAAKPSDAELQQAYRDGQISRKAYLAVTREVRTFDQVKFMEYLRRSPRDALSLLRRITRKGKSQSSLFLREQ